MKYIKIRDAKVISVVGAGGKTSTILSLKDTWKHQAKTGESLIITTTTAMFEPSKRDVDYLIFTDNCDVKDIIEHVTFIGNDEKSNPKIVGVFRNKLRLEDHTKTKGINPNLVDLIGETKTFEHIIVEADGAKRKSMKAYEIHEPVIPKSTELVIIVMGLSVLNKKINESTVHRASNFLKLVNKQENDILEFKDFPKLFIGDMGFLRGVPEKANVLVFMNQYDSVENNCFLEEENVFEEILKIDERIKGIVVGSMQKDQCIKEYLK